MLCLSLGSLLSLSAFTSICIASVDTGISLWPRFFSVFMRRVWMTPLYSSDKYWTQWSLRSHSIFYQVFSRVFFYQACNFSTVLEFYFCLCDVQCISNFQDNPKMYCIKFLINISIHVICFPNCPHLRSIKNIDLIIVLYALILVYFRTKFDLEILFITPAALL